MSRRSRSRGTADSGLDRPPDDPAELSRFPWTRKLPGTLHRLSEHAGPWWFSSLGAGGAGRFDLPAPEGTCYWADDLAAALGEKLLRRPKRVVPAERLRELRHARARVVEAPRLADLTSPRAAGFGVNAEIHSTLEYAKPRVWAERLRRAGRRGLRYLVRSDPAVRGGAVALFGSAGLHRRAPAGFHTRVEPLDEAEAREVLEERGVRVMPIPFEVPTVDGPGRGGGGP